MTENTPPPLSFAFTILRQAAGVKQKHAARAAGIDPSVLCKLESGAEPMTPKWSADLLAAIEVQPERLDVGLFCAGLLLPSRSLPGGPVELVQTRWLTEDWIGRELTDSSIADLRAVRERNGLDLCGEEGEYHTLVTDGPQFSQTIDIRSYSKRAEDSLAYMEIHELELTAK